MNKLAQALGYGPSQTMTNYLARPRANNWAGTGNQDLPPADWERSVFKPFVDAYTFPARVYRGKADPYDIGEALNFTTAFGPGAIGSAMAKAKPGFYARHGTPAKLDAFDLSRAGSQSGVSAKGRGVYMTESADVARGYGPNVYEARINAPRTDFMDWDVPLADQPQLTRRLESIPEYNALMREAIDPDLGPPRGSDMLMPILQGRQWPSGTDMYGPEVTGVLRDAGIPGITWAERGARNYSVFDPGTMSRPRQVR